MCYRTFKYLCFLITLFSILSFTKNVSGQKVDHLKKEVTINLPADSLINTLRKIELKTNINFAYASDQLSTKYNAKINVSHMRLGALLEEVLFGTGLGFSLIGNDIVITPKKPITWTIHGHVLDKASGEVLMGATVQIPSLKIGVIANQYGFYSISVPEGNYQIQISNAGYQTRQEFIRLDKDLLNEIELSFQERQLEEVVIMQSTLTPNPILFNEQNITQNQLYNTVYNAGETDILKKLQMENGIKAITEGSSGLFVRGGNADQNLILLDEAIVYNPSHLYGLVSIFNPDAISNIQVYKDYMPANFGGRLSSVIVNRMAEGNSKEYHLSGSVNLMSARLSAEGPLVKNKASFIVAYRRSLLDVFHNKLKLFNPRSVYYDINAKVNYKLNINNTLFYSVYLGKDNLLSTDNYSNNWGNLTSTLRWNHVFSSKLFANISAISSNYSNLLDLNADTLSQKSQWQTAVRDFTVKADYTYYSSPGNQIKFGASSIFHRFMPGEMYKQESFEFNIAKNKSIESTLYYSQQLSLGKSFELNYGLRLSMFRNAQEKRNVFDESGNLLKQEEIKTFINPEPRVNFNYLAGNNERVFITYNLNYQYLQLIQNNPLAFSSLESWIPASTAIKPQRSAHFSLGYRYSPDHFMFSANAYYKKLENQLELIGHAQIIRNPDVAAQLRSGTSNVYGIETEIEKSTGRVSGNLAYTYSKAYRKIGDINYGNRFAANYDIPHEIKLVVKYNFSERLSFQSFFTYSTGRPLTLPVGYYQHDGLNVPIFEGRNTSRFPDFSRLDISSQYRFKSDISSKRSLVSVVSVGLYNLYNRKNALYYHLNSSSFENKPNTFEYAFGLYPWIAYSFKI
ncbi:TonB-dependent receptor domain-containing protein [Pedobacter sp.]|uniref:TonB-dependent receptor domain-containing protein n=1 Tax=Pedobacter sp. TaxID=1411316 RepID=UPI003D7FECCA